MSRIGKAPIVLPEGITVDIGSNVIKVKNTKAELSRSYDPTIIHFDLEDKKIVLKLQNNEHGAYHGLMRKLVNNMVEGLNKGFEKKLEINGVGYKAAVQGKKIAMTLGYSHVIDVPIPDGLVVEVAENTKISIKGPDKELVGRYADQLRALKKPEPYLGKGIKYSDEIIRRKVGKTGA